MGASSGFADAVLELVDAVPPGRVVTYGDVATLLGRPPVAARAVGRVMATAGGEVCWWRVVTARGDLAPHLIAVAREHWRREATPLLPDGRVDVPRARWDG
ncbi:MAG: MGMT family protein [Kineosporiaceae bacterium]